MDTYGEDPRSGPVEAWDRGNYRGPRRSWAVRPEASVHPRMPGSRHFIEEWTGWDLNPEHQPGKASISLEGCALEANGSDDGPLAPLAQSGTFRPQDHASCRELRIPTMEPIAMHNWSPSGQWSPESLTPSLEVFVWQTVVVNLHTDGFFIRVLESMRKLLCGGTSN